MGATLRCTNELNMQAVKGAEKVGAAVAMTMILENISKAKRRSYVSEERLCCFVLQMSIQFAYEDRCLSFNSWK